MSPQTVSDHPEAQKRVLARYDDTIQYYWKKARSNRTAYTRTRYLTVVLGASVTLVSTVSAAHLFKDTPWADAFFAILTPIMAAGSAIVAGISQNFQFGPAWSDMSITASQLQKERDRVSEMRPDEIDTLKEMDILNDLVLSETQGFFQRLFGNGVPPKDAGNPPVNKQ
jgi:hypothetical protein